MTFSLKGLKTITKYQYEPACGILSLLDILVMSISLDFLPNVFVLVIDLLAQEPKFSCDDILNCHEIPIVKLDHNIHFACSGILRRGILHC